jgi:hypothetical protein
VLAESAQQVACTEHTYLGIPTGRPSREPAGT